MKRMKKEEKKKIRLHHVGITANTPAIKNLLTGFLNLNERTWFNKDQGVDVTFLPVGNAYLEMVYPHGNPSIEKYIAEHGEGIHHFCFEVDDLDYWVKECEQKGFKVVSKDSRAFFIHPKTFGGILVEFIDLTKDALMPELSLMDNRAEVKKV
jgi:methylmalonyl-CoA/ethylmalonyl-CoA epimerase